MTNMDTFRTPIRMDKQDWNLTQAQRTLCLGSCFADNIGQKLIEHKFNALVNPLGIIFNPSSLADNMEKMMENPEIGEEDLFFHGDCWNSFSFHSCFSHPEKRSCLRQIREAMQRAHDFILQTDCLILSLGTNTLYSLKDNGKVVANCHKMPSETFEKKDLPVEEMRNIMKGMLSSLQAIRPNLRCILTVSPVRHLRSQLVQNSYSKACLRVLAHELQQDFDWVSYFPSYEIMMDDLRDYRFYAPDRTHPSDEAVNYIWERFSEAYFDDSVRNLNQEIEKVEAAFHHRPVFPQTENYRSFCRQCIEKIQALQTQCPHLDFTEEKTYFEQFV